MRRDVIEFVEDEDEIMDRSDDEQPESSGEESNSDDSENLEENN